MCVYVYICDNLPSILCGDTRVVPCSSMSASRTPAYSADTRAAAPILQRHTHTHTHTHTRVRKRAGNRFCVLVKCV